MILFTTEKTSTSPVPGRQELEASRKAIFDWEVRSDCTGYWAVAPGLPAMPANIDQVVDIKQIKEVR
jgi:hypothetical protein